MASTDRDRRNASNRRMVDPMTEQSPAVSIMDDDVWNNFCDQLKNAGQVILREKSPDNELDRAEGWRYLTRLKALSKLLPVQISV